MTAQPAAIDLDALRGILDTVVAPWVAELGLQLQQAAPGEVVLALPVARVLRMGRKLVFGEIEILDARGELAAHATTTYALV
jgi:acyl-coenzyme A thioesterase PaaI-like protein